jgi:hypothetical protein
MDSNSSSLSNSSIPSKSFNLHSPYFKETNNTRFISLLVLIIFGFTLLILKLFGSLFTSCSQMFFFKALTRIFKEMLLYFVLLTFVYVLWTFGLFDDIKINWEYTLASIGLFGLCWIVFCFIIISFCILAASKWAELEKHCLNSFGILIFILVELRAYYKIDLEGKKSNLIYYKELFQYLLLKTQFCVPFYPVFKPSVLNKDFRFDIYLSLSLLKKLKLFFRFSWTSWFIVICSFLIWTIYIAPRSVQFIVYNF